MSEFCDHYFSVASDYIISKLDKALFVDTSQIFILVAYNHDFSVNALFSNCYLGLEHK